MDRATTRSPIPIRRPALVLAAVLLATLALVQVRTAFSSNEWCWDDPVVSLNGQVMSVTAGVQGSATSVAAAHVVANIVVYVPAGVTITVVTPPPTTGPFVETLTIVTRGTWQPGTPISVVVTTTFTSTARLAATMQVTAPGGKTTHDTGTTRDTLVSLVSE